MEHAALNADKACGSGTRFIFYMEIGEVLSRPFTVKDTHTPQGDLIVTFTDTERSHPECIRRAMGADILLGFSPPCFTYGSDLILPAELNGQLRGLLHANKVLEQVARRVKQPRPKAAEEDLDDDLTRVLASISALHRQHATVFIPEVWVP